mmetsp:Transcript_99058/g.317758  ORF Transcript_99058/g.317758 Transcript_99058/m.317758 type:complete len:200 (+) Transcript_99058:446-1045(+)
MRPRAMLEPLPPLPPLAVLLLPARVAAARVVAVREEGKPRIPMPRCSSASEVPRWIPKNRPSWRPWQRRGSAKRRATTLQPVAAASPAQLPPAVPAPRPLRKLPRRLPLLSRTATLAVPGRGTRTRTRASSTSTTAARRNPVGRSPPSSPPPKAPPRTPRPPRPTSPRPWPASWRPPARRPSPSSPTTSPTLLSVATRP